LTGRRSTSLGGMVALVSLALHQCSASADKVSADSTQPRQETRRSPGTVLQ